MAGTVNKVIIVGRLGKDPEARNTQSGAKIVNLTVATSDTWKDRQTGEKKERTEWHRVVVFNERCAEFADRYLRKGALVYIEGELRTRKWTDQSGQERYTTEVVIDRFRGDLVSMDSGPRDDGYEDRRGPGTNSRNGNGGTSTGTGRDSRGDWNAPPDNDVDDEIPF